MKSTLYIWILLLGIFVCYSCSKKEFLDAKYNQELVIPKSLSDMQKLLDNDNILNGYTSTGVVPSLGEIGSDDYFIRGSVLNTLPQVMRNQYLWDKNPYPATDLSDWNNPYQAIFYANTVLKGLNEIPITSANNTDWKNIQGAALFYRGHMFYQLAQIFSPAYNPSSAKTDLGVPLRLGTDINELINRASLEETYAQIFKDLWLSVELLPTTPVYKTRPSKPAALALLSRIHLTLNNFDSAFYYSNAALGLVSALMDYNSSSLDLDGWPCFQQFNDEVLFSCTLVTTFHLPSAYGRVDTVLLASYADNDLRKRAYFYITSSGAYFKGSYDGTDYSFAGIATDELYLIRAESYARSGKSQEAVSDLNTLLSKRIDKNSFIPIGNISADEALKLIVSERRKELLYRGLRWIDLRRLNTDPGFTTTLQRIVDGTTYTLAPTDLRYTWLIPDNVIGFNEGMPQNPR